MPLVGTFVNWWAPPPKQAVRGRKLDLAEGTLHILGLFVVVVTPCSELLNCS